MDQLPLENFENSRVRAFVLSKYSYGLLLPKNWSLVGRMFDYGKKGEFLALNHFYSWIIFFCAQTSVFD